MIENINAILTKNLLTAVRSFVGGGSKREQRQWWNMYQKTFQDAPPPTIDHIQIIKECYERELTDNSIDDMTQIDDMTLNAALFMADDSPVFEAFKMLDAFFDFNAARRKRNDLLICHPPISKKQREETNYIAPSKKPSEARYNQFNNRLLQEFNKQRELTKTLKENIKRATVLLELYPFREAIIKAMNSPNKKLEREDKNVTRNEILTKAQELKKNGMEVPDMFNEICNWLLDDLGFKKPEIKKRYNFSLDDAHSFNRLANKHVPYHN